MAQEIQINAYLRCDNGNYKLPRTGLTKKVDQTNTGGGGPGTLLVSTTANGDAIDLSSFTSVGVGLVRNVDDTNYVELGHWDGVTFHPFLKLMPNAEPQMIRLASSASLRAKANTAACLVNFTFLEA